MDGFSYFNIFETKGIEYIAILTFFACLIPFWIVLNKQVKISRQIQKVLGILSAGSLRIPQGLFYCNNHTWTHLERSGSAKIGIDDFLLHVTGEVKFNFLRNEGETISKGDPLAEVNQDGKILRILSPISGVVMKSNSYLNENPETLEEDPYGQGWIYKVKPSSWVKETSNYYLADEATKWSTMELDRFKDFLAVSMKNQSPDASRIILQDGGEISEQVLSHLPKEVWMDFQKDFLSDVAGK